MLVSLVADNYDPLKRSKAILTLHLLSHHSYLLVRLLTSDIIDQNNDHKVVFRLKNTLIDLPYLYLSDLDLILNIRMCPDCLILPILVNP